MRPTNFYFYIFILFYPPPFLPPPKKNKPEYSSKFVLNQHTYNTPKINLRNRTCLHPQLIKDFKKLTISASKIMLFTYSERWKSIFRRGPRKRSLYGAFIMVLHTFMLLSMFYTKRKEGKGDGVLKLSRWNVWYCTF